MVINKTGSNDVTLSTNASVGNRLAVNSGTTLFAGNQLLTLTSNGTSTAFVTPLPTGASIEGNVIVQRHLPNAAGIRAWRYITPSVTGSFVSDWKVELKITGTFSDPFAGIGINNTSPSLYIYDETFTSGAGLDRYRPYPTSGPSSAAPLQNAVGYAVFVRETTPITYDTRGRLGQGPVQVNVTNSGGVNSGYNVIGNPYPCPIDWDLVIPGLPGVINNAIYLINNTNNGGAGRDVSYVGGVSVPAPFDGKIASGQTFYLRTTGNASFNFQETHKFSGQAQFFREGEIPNLLRISVNGAGITDETAIRLHEEATDSFDGRFDADKFFTSDLSISSIGSNNQKFSINSLSSLGCGKTVPLMIETESKGNFTLDFTGMESFENGMGIHLKDKLLGELVDITTVGQYAFETNEGVSLKNRFEIIFDGAAIETDLQIAAENVCEKGASALVTIFNSQQNVSYTAQLNGQSISKETPGNGADLEISIATESIGSGDLEIAILASSEGCTSMALKNKAIIKVIPTPRIGSVEHGAVCNAGPVALRVKGSGHTYRWYEDKEGTNPIANITTSDFVTPALKKSKTYYVSAVNELGCEGDRVAVRADVIYTDPVTIEQVGLTLNFKP